MLLHILWIILKIILILLGIIVGLVVLVLLLLLFCPVRYKASAEIEQGILQSRVQAWVSWIFHGILLEFIYEGQEAKSRIRIIGISFSWIREKRKYLSKCRRKRRVSRRKPSQPQKQEKKEERELCMEELPAAQEKQKNPQEFHNREKEKNVVPEAEIGEEKFKRNLFQKIRNKPAAFWGKLKRIEKTLKKLKKVVKKWEWWKLFLENPKVQKAFTLTKKETLRLIKHILPTKTSGEIEFGCEDPSLTGMVLAVLGITMPIHKNCVGITPVYSGENILKGKVILKGRIYGIVILVSVIKIYFNKDVKYTISRWKRKEG